MNYPDVDCTIYGLAPPSMKNSRQIVTIKSRPRLIKSKRALTYKTVFDEQCPVLDELLEGDLMMRVDVWYDTLRPDLAALDYIMDLCQKKFYLNDKQIKMNMSVFNLARKDPRCRIRIKRLPHDNIENRSTWYDPCALMDFDHEPGRDDVDGAE
jgi:Holliday junction resolvase RusA-like endonuclease